MSTDPPARLFVVGAPRSGTTLVQSLLASHSSATSFTESHFFSRSYVALPLLSSAVLVRDPRPRLREFLAENDAENARLSGWLSESFSPPERGRARLAMRSRGAARGFVTLLDTLAAERERGLWIEKTPMHLRYVPFLERLLKESSGRPAVRFVHVIRRGVDVVASLHRASRQWERAYSLEECVKRWNKDVALSLRRLGSPSDAFVYYEALTENPERTARRLFADVGLSFEEDVLERYARTSNALVTGSETWKAGVRGEIEPSEGAAASLDSAERERVRFMLKEGLYERLAQRAREERR